MTNVPARICCGVAGVEREQRSSQRNLAFRVLGTRDLKNMHEAFVCYRAAGIQKKIAFLDHRNCLQHKQGQGGDKATKGTEMEKHILLETGEIKWCWRCGACVERNSAPRLLLKTACSGAPRTKEYERALSLLGKAQHPKSAVF